MGIDVLFGTIETIEHSDDGKVKTTVIRKRQGKVYSTTVRYTDTVRPTDKQGVLAAFIQFIDSVDLKEANLEFRVRPTVYDTYTVERSWTEKTKNT